VESWETRQILQKRRGRRSEYVSRVWKGFREERAKRIWRWRVRALGDGSRAALPWSPQIISKISDTEFGMYPSLFERVLDATLILRKWGRKARSWNWPGASSSARKLSESLSKTAELHLEVSATMCENFSVNEDFLVCLRSPGWAQALGRDSRGRAQNPKQSRLISKGLDWKLKQIKGWFQGLTWRFLMGNLTEVSKLSFKLFRGLLSIKLKSLWSKKGKEMAFTKGLSTTPPIEH
jgi:hypothetical protein